MTSPVDKVQYLYRHNLRSEQRLMAGYFREQINHFGIPITYFRYMTDFFTEPVSSNIYANYTYGEQPIATYPLSADMNVFVSMTEDNSILKRFGLETSCNAEMYMMQEDFTETFRDIVGTPTSGYYTARIDAAIASFTGMLSASVLSGDLQAMTSAYTTTPSGSTTAFYDCPVLRVPKAWNADLAATQYYTERHIDGRLTGYLSSTVDASGNGRVSGEIRGRLSYFSSLSEPSAPVVWAIAPRVGDFFRMREFDEDVSNFEEYEITQVEDKSLTPQGLNPLLKRYLWKCSIVRRSPSHEIVAGTVQQEAFTPNYLADNQWHEAVSDNQIFDYVNPVDGIDYKQDEDNVYGGYGMR